MKFCPISLVYVGPIIRGEVTRNSEIPNNAIDLFVEKRLVLILENLKQKLQGILLDEIDTKPEINLANAIAT
jgi:hypothetical protein